MQLLKRIGRRVEVAAREVEIHRRVRQVGVTEQELNRAQVRTRFQQMRGVGVPERVRRDAFVEAGLSSGEAYGIPDYLRGDRCIGTPPVARPRKEIGLRAHPSVVLTECGEKRGTQGNLTIAAALALLDAEHHAVTIDVPDSELARFGAPQAGAIERQEQRAVIQILRARNAGPRLD